MNMKAEPGIVTPRAYARAAIVKIGKQFPTSPDGKLMFAIVANAILDLLEKSERNEAIRYLRGDMWHANKCGVEPDWIRKVLTECGVDYAR